jgi:hypothetical protein
MAWYGLLTLGLTPKSVCRMRYRGSYYPALKVAPFWTTSLGSGVESFQVDVKELAYRSQFTGDVTGDGVDVVGTKA